MSSEIILRDKNHVTVGAAVTSDSSQGVTMLRVDPVTKYLLVNISTGNASAGTSSQVAHRDQNHVHTCLAWDETNQVLQEILTDSSGNLLCDVIFV